MKHRVSTSQQGLKRQLSTLPAPVQRRKQTAPAERVLQLQRALGNQATQSLLQRRSSTDGATLPMGLQHSLEHMSGLDMSDVRVHYNSPKPATVQAKAYAQGSEIHLASGQEQHLPHEAWHVVQQKQDRVKATGDIGGIPLNDEVSLEREADRMGRLAAADAPRQRKRLAANQYLIP